MFIYQFNRLIRSRLLWGFFAIIISVAFVSVGSCGRSAGGGSDPGVAGKLNGKKISVAAYDQVDGFIRGFGRNRNTEIPEREVARRVWEQLAARQVAAKNGVTSGKEDIREAIRSQSV
ncbi:MAG: SurA N-terminal domain-containing protein, partial [Kiritimatiellaeota bacterium]|nr:SurA N-terminal domain-containing protein [Kiritimatiellota bacterium]